MVVAGGYPGDALSRGHVGDLLRGEGLLQNHAIEPLCILDLGDLEMLEGLHEAGSSPGEVLARWKRSGLSDVPFRNFVMRVYPSLERPSRMYERVRAAMMDAAHLLSGW